MTKGRVICVTGIDTDIGKTIVTGLLGKYLRDRGKSAITQKICQTGCQELSADIIVHRKIMGMELVDEDKNGATCPYVFTEAASPHLAAKLENIKINLQRITEATSLLQQRYDFILLEGVGGLMVPLTEETLLIDYIQEQNYENILVSCSRLGSINHTLSALEIMYNKGMGLNGIIYNRFFNDNESITEDSRMVFSTYLSRYGYQNNIVDIPTYHPESTDERCDFSSVVLE